MLLTINAGSSSIKFAGFEAADNLERVLHGSIQNINTTPVLKLIGKDGVIVREEKFDTPKEYNYFYQLLLNYIASSRDVILAIGHRVVHGGQKYHAPLKITKPIIDDLKLLIPFAPLHQPFNIEAIEILHQSLPQLTQVACFDTAFHATHPPVADYFGIPRSLTQSGIKRYGFHGLSYEFIIHRLKELTPHNLKDRIVVAHLGNGASMCAVKNGKSIDSTMGFTALDGLMMGSRCGTIDPGVILYLMKYKNMSHDDIENLLYKKSGLLGVSQESNDMQVLLNSKSQNAQDAISLYVYRIRRELGALVSVLGGIEMLVFTGGVGENAAPIREAACKNMEWLGIKLDKSRNNENQTIISSPQSEVEVRVIPTNEEWIIAKHTFNMINMEK